MSIIISLAVLGLGTYFALTVELFSWDVDITLWMQRLDLGPFRFIRKWLSWTGFVGFIGVVWALIFCILWSTRHKTEAFFLALIAVPDLFNILLKGIIGRARPSGELATVLGDPQGFSFPSAHSLHVLLFYGFLMYIAGRNMHSGRTLYFLWAIGISYILATGLWLIHDGRHWFTDVMGGYIYAIFYLLVFIAAIRLVEKWFQGPHAIRLYNRLPRFLRVILEYNPGQCCP